jgi:hypothetical protein
MAARLIYLHGFASGPGSHKAQLFRRRFAERGVRLEVPDLTAGDFEHLTVSGQLAVIERVAEGEPVRLMGSSLGGYLAALYAARHPEVERLVLMAPAFGFGRRFLDSLGQGEGESWRDSGGRAVFNYSTGREERLWWRLIEDALEFEEFPEVRQPTLVFHGRGDDQVPYALSEEFARRHTQARLELLDDGHQLLGSVERIWGVARAFLA